MIMTKKRFAYIGGALLTLALLSGCGSSTNSKDPLKCGVSYPCGGCEGKCPYTSTYSSLFEPLRED